nr:iron chelate uptake ABC transporter family permease subunit [Veillonella denticariosi]
MIPVGGGLQSILHGIGIPISFAEPISAEQESVLWFIRMPRLMIGLLVGAALALAGAVMQGGYFQILWRIPASWASPQGGPHWVPLSPSHLA